MTDHQPDEIAISVVIPCYRDQTALGSCLERLAGQRGAPAFEVVVVDNGNDPAVTIEQAGLRVRVIVEERPGAYVARNRGVREASGALLAFTDADCLPQSGWLAAVAAAHRTQPDAIVAGAVRLSDPERSLLSRLQLALAFDQEFYVREKSFGATANLSMPRPIFDLVGGFDERLRSGGDREWCRRAVLLNHVPIVFEPAAVVEHPPRSLRALATKERRLLGGQITADRLGLSHTVGDAFGEEPDRPLARRSRPVRWLVMLGRHFSEPLRTIGDARQRGARIAARDVPGFAAVLFVLGVVRRLEGIRLRRGAEPERR